MEKNTQAIIQPSNNTFERNNHNAQTLHLWAGCCRAIVSSQATLQSRENGLGYSQVTGSIKRPLGVGEKALKMVAQLQQRGSHH